MADQPDRRRAILPSPPASPEPANDEFADFPRRLLQPDVASGLLFGATEAGGGVTAGGFGEAIPFATVPAREQGAGPARDVIAGTIPYTEGRELRPEGPFPTEGRGWTLHHEHHHIVEVMEQGKRSHAAVRFRLDPGAAGQPGPPIRVLHTDSERWRAWILNLASSTSVVTIGDERVAPGADNGFDIAVGGTLEIHDEAEVWACIPAGGAAQLCIWITRTGPWRGDTQGAPTDLME